MIMTTMVMMMVKGEKSKAGIADSRKQFLRSKVAASRRQGILEPKEFFRRKTWGGDEKRRHSWW